MTGCQAKCLRPTAVVNRNVVYFCGGSSLGSQREILDYYWVGTTCRGENWLNCDEDHHSQCPISAH